MPPLLHRIKAIIFFGCALSLFLGGCAAVSVKDDPRPVEDVISRAEQLIENKAYAAPYNAKKLLTLL